MVVFSASIKWPRTGWQSEPPTGRPGLPAGRAQFGTTSPEYKWGLRRSRIIQLFPAASVFRSEQSAKMQHSLAVFRPVGLEEIIARLSSWIIAKRFGGYSQCSA
jgi:hypothetical protein